LVRQRLQQLEDMAHRGILGNRQLIHTVELEPLHQQRELGAREQSTVYRNAAVVHPDRDALVLEQGHQRAELPLLILLLRGIAKQVHGARQMRGECFGSERHRLSI
jgi:hypothetical protein